MTKPFAGTAAQTEEGLWVARRAQQLADETQATRARPGLLQRRDRHETVYGPTGRPIAKVKVSDWGNTEHEFDDHQDAVARPRTVTASMAEARDRVAVAVPTDPLPGGHYDLELARIRARLEQSPHDRGLWLEYRSVKAQAVAALQARKALRDKALRG